MCMLFRFPLFPLSFLNELISISMNCLCNTWTRIWYKHGLRNLPIGCFIVLGNELNLHQFCSTQVNLLHWEKFETIDTHTIYIEVSLVIIKGYMNGWYTIIDSKLPGHWQFPNIKIYSNKCILIEMNEIVNSEIFLPPFYPRSVCYSL